MKTLRKIRDALVCPIGVDLMDIMIWICILIWGAVGVIGLFALRIGI